MGQAQGQGRGLGRPQACTDGRQRARRSPRQGLGAGHGERGPQGYKDLAHWTSTQRWCLTGSPMANSMCVPGPHCLSLADSGLPRAVHTLAALVSTHPPPSPQLRLSASRTLIPSHCLQCSGPPEVAASRAGSAHQSNHTVTLGNWQGLPLSLWQAWLSVQRGDLNFTV